MKAARPALLLLAWLLRPDVGLAQNAELDVTEWTLNSLVRRMGALSDTGMYRSIPPVVLERYGTTPEDCSYWGTLECPGLDYKALGFESPRIPLAICKTGASRSGSAHLLGDSVLTPLRASVRWQWWVLDPRFTVRAGSLSFTATVRWRVGETIQTETRTVPASVSFDAAANRVRFDIGSFVVPMQWQIGGGIETIKEVDVAKLYRIAVPIPPQTFAIPRPAGGEAKVVARGVGLTTEFLHERVRTTIQLEFQRE